MNSRLQDRLSHATQRGNSTRVLVDTWELLEELGRGEFSIVYAARPVEARQAPPAYAVKLLREAWQEEDETVGMLRREAAVGMQIAHPRLLPVLSSHVLEAPYFLVLPKVNGGTLRQRLQDQPVMPVPEALWLVRQAAEGLAALHEAGWRHGDVKPENLLVSPEDHLTLCDFSFARRSDDRGEPAEAGLLGSPAYLAPELFVSQLRGSPASDVYSLGVVLFELVTGQRPYAEESLEQLAAAHLRLQPRALRTLAPGIPREVDRLASRMLAKEPLRRPHPAELIAELMRLEVSTFLLR